MTEEEFNKLKRGDMVRIVKKCTDRMNKHGAMDKWLGKVMTVRNAVNNDCVRMEEDCNENYYNGWFWDKNMIKCKVSSVTRINIITRGNKIIAKRDKKVGIAKRSPKDKADEAKGVIIAVARLYGYDVVTDEEGKVTLADKMIIVKEIGDKPTEKPSGEKEYELLPWDEALKAAKENDLDDVAVDNTEICYISKVSWEKLRKFRIIRIEDYVGNGRLRYITVEQPKGETDMFYVPACCIREKGEKTMKEETAKDRVKKELAELEEKIEKLTRALAPLADKIGTETEAYSLLNLQLGVMRTYADILRRRLAIWKD